MLSGTGTNMFKISKSNKEKLFTIVAYAGLIYGTYLCFLENNFWPLLISLLIYAWHSTIGHHCAMHRMYSHRGFTTGPIRHFWLLIEATLCGVGIGPITYAAVHRAHHAHTDTDRDPHSPQTSNPFYITFGLHIFRKDDDRRNSGFRLPKDLMRIKSLRFVETHYHSIWLLGLLIIWALFGFEILLYGFVVPSGIFIILSNTFVNVLAHINLPFSYRNFDTTDASKNNMVMQILSRGESLHNNHHHEQNALNQAFKKGELDPVWYLLKWIFLDKETIAKHENAYKIKS